MSTVVVVCHHQMQPMTLCPDIEAPASADTDRGRGRLKRSRHVKRSIPANEALDSSLARVPNWPRCGWPMCHRFPARKYGVPLCDDHIVAAVRRYETVENNRIPIAKVERIERKIQWLELENDRLRKLLGIKLENDAVGKPEPTPKSGVVYYVQVTEHIKIGWTSDLPGRMKSYPPNSRLLAAEPGTRKDEQRIHRMLAVHRAYGNEWYAPTPTVLHHIESVKRRHGEPDQVIVGAKPVVIPEPREQQYVGGTTKLNTGSRARPVRG